MAEIVQALARVRNGLTTAGMTSGMVEGLCRSLGFAFRERLLTPATTVRLFLLQILFGNTAITHLRQLAGFDFAASSYCAARLRLPLALLRAMLVWTVDQTRSAGAIGPRVLLVDGSSFAVSDTPALRKRFGLPRGRGVIQGVTYPLAKIVGLIDAASGLFVDCLCTTLYRHDVGLVSSLHRSLRAGDVLLGDRAFCSFAHVALLNACGVFACFGLHQRRKIHAGRRRQRWDKPPECPAWLDPAAFAAMPAFVEVRVVSYRCGGAGFRTRHVHVATTLSGGVWSDRRVAELYGHRWRIETCLDHLKTTMKGNVLKCQSVGGVAREHLMYLLAYNLVRLSMLAWASRVGVSVWRVSFIDALRQLAVRLTGLSGVENLLQVPLRPGRHEPRVVRRRMKEYDLLNQPRAVRKQQEKQRWEA